MVAFIARKTRTDGVQEEKPVRRDCCTGKGENGRGAAAARRAGAERGGQLQLQSNTLAFSAGSRRRAA